MKTFISFIFAMVLTVQGAFAFDSDSGTLVRNPYAANFDWKYLPALSSPRANLIQGQTLKLQSRFVWYGSTGSYITTEQHAIVAFTQQNASDTMLNTTGAPLWSHGVGAYVGERGLELELWYRTASNQQNAVVWSQDHGRCIQDVLGLFSPSTGCIAGTVSTGDYITSAPNFQLKRGIYYWVRVTLTNAGVNLTNLHADLLEETAQGVNVVQSAQVKFTTDAFFPSLQDITATVARTPGSADEPFINWVAFDGGF